MGALMLGGGQHVWGYRVAPWGIWGLVCDSKTWNLLKQEADFSWLPRHDVGVALVCGCCSATPLPRCPVK